MKNKLKAISVKHAADGKLQDGDGLVLIKAGESGKWIYRYSHLGRRREMGLGRWPDISLADARRSRDEWKAELLAGRDPITTRDAQRQAEIERREQADPTFADLTRTVFEAKQAGLRAGGERGRWMSPLVTHILPRIGNKRISKLTRFDVAEALRPIWRKKHPTAIKAYNRTRQVFTEGRFMGYDCDPFEVEAATRILGDVRHVSTPIRATPWQEVPALYARFGDAFSDECLRFMLLTLVRLDGCVGARHSEISDGIWTVPAERIKGTEGTVRDFRVPLSAEAQAVVDRLKPFTEDLIFAPNGKAISSNALAYRLDHMNEAGRPHGFRTSFRTWVQDTDACSWEVSETVLGHTVGNKVERSYARSDLLERRRTVMEAWARHVTGQQSARVVNLRCE